jgi:hypothetical protein
MADKVKIYCGTSSNLPAGYGRFGNRYECMQCGYGSATMKYKWAQPSRSPKPVERTRKGCYRSRKPKRRSPNRKAKRRSPKRKSKRKSRKSKRKSKRRSPKRKSKRRSPKRKSKRRSPKRKSKRRSPKRKSKRRSPKRKAKRRSPSRAQINKWILEELNRKRRSK